MEKDINFVETNSKKPKAMTTYTTFEQEIKGNIFSLTVASGKYNYINISKLTNNPFRTAGKDYENYDKAVLAYKSPEMKSFILQVEMNLLMPKRSFIA